MRRAVYILFSNRIWMDDGSRDNHIGLLNNAYLKTMHANKTIKTSRGYIKTYDISLAIAANIIIKVKFKNLQNREKEILGEILSGNADYLHCEETENPSVVKVFSKYKDKFFVFNYLSGEIIG